jgi:hypothetical protein
MKKINRKLIVHSEIVRVLRTLDNIDLARARGGVDSPDAAGTDRTQSGINCPAQANILVPK